MNMQLEFPACIARAAAALQQLCAVIEEPNCASAELAEARRWLELAARQAFDRTTFTSPPSGYSRWNS